MHWKVGVHKITSLAKSAIFYYNFRVNLNFMDENSQKPNTPTVNKWSLVSLATEFGFIIAIPLVAFALAGKWLDGRINTFPWMTLLGIALAITATTVWMTKRLKSYIK